MNPQSLFSKKLLLVTGKGGIGKSLISASLGLMAAAAGKRVCLVESGVDDQLAPLFGLPPVGHHLTEAAPGISVINLNSQDNFRDFIVLHLGMGKVFEKIFTKSIVRSFVRMIPGITEITLLGRLYYYCEEVEDPFDLVILDGWSSGHFLGLMKTPDAILNSGMVGPVIKETRKVRDFVADQSKTGIIQVTNTEELVLTECEEFLELYRKETHVHQTAVLINRLQPPPLRVPQQMVHQRRLPRSQVPANHRHGDCCHLISGIHLTSRIPDSDPHTPPTPVCHRGFEERYVSKSEIPTKVGTQSV